MKKFLSALFLPLFLMASDAGFYVWQREYSSELKSAVSYFYRQSNGELYFLAGELENDEKAVTISPAPFIDFKRTTAVIRIHIRNLDKRPDILAEKILPLYTPWSKTGKLQIDLDCPESKLDYYPELIKALSKKLPDTRISATVLPCHLSHYRKFSKLAEVCDYFVLQVHGLHQKNGRWQIMDRQTALQAWNKARQYKKNFKTAIPLYSNYVEGKCITPDLDFTAKLAQVAQKTGGVIGFRLGIDGDRNSLDLASGIKIVIGIKVEPEISLVWKEQSSGAWHLLLRSTGIFSQKVKIRLNLPPDAEITDFDTFNGAETVDGIKYISLILPPCGREKAYLWLRCKTKIDFNKFNSKIKDFEIL